MIHWRNIAFFSFILFGFIFILYELLGSSSKGKAASIQQTSDELIEKEKIIAKEYDDKAKLADEEKKSGTPCCRRNENTLLGKLTVDKTKIPSLSELETKLPFVKSGGHGEPLSCRPTVKVAIIVAYRDRMDNLLIFLRHMHKLLHRQRLYYQLFIVEQAESDSFNKGKLQNVGFVEALKYDDFECFVFHDVDMMPEDDRNFYDCPSSPRHMSPALDKFDYKMYSPDLFGGVVAFSKNDFLDLNGYSNSFYGTAGENEDMGTRMFHKKKRLTRPVLEIGRYSMLTHKRMIKKKEKADKQQRDKISHEDVDGLKKLRYKVIHNDKYKLFTLIKVDLQWDKKQEVAF